MDIAFKCPACEQELVVDTSGAGSEIQCPSCGEVLIVPTPEAPPASAPPAEPNLNPIATSAAAKEEKHFKVPEHKGPAEILIKKANKPLEVAAKESDRKLRIKTIRRADCLELGHDKFDEMVADMLNKIGEQYIVGIHPINYTHLDPTTQKLIEDYGVLIVFKG